MNEPWITFNLQGQKYCCNAMHVKEVITYRPANPIPGSPDYVEGMINVRGNFITLYSGRALYDLPEATPDDNWRIILMEDDDSLFAVSTDQVEQIVYLNDGEWDTSNASNDNAILGTVTVRSELIVVADLLGLCQTLADQQARD